MQKYQSDKMLPSLNFHQNGISCRSGTEFWDHILDLISGFGSADRNVVKNDHDYESFIIVTVICLRLWCRLSIKQSWNCVNENPEFNVWTAACRWCYGFSQVVLYCMPKVFINIKNRTVCFQERFRLLSLAAVLRKHPSWFQNPITLAFEIAMSAF